MEVRKPELDSILQRHLHLLMTKKDIKHAIMAVESMDGSFRWSGAEGIAHPDRTVMTPGTPFCIASVTKLFIATTILKLHEQGRLSIDRPMSTYLPSDMIRGLNRSGDVDHTEQITLRHLLGHSSGIPDYLEIHRKNEKSIFENVIVEGDRSFSIEDFLDVVRDVNSPNFPPQPLDAKKKKIRYSDTNYQLLIAVIKQVTGKSLHEAFRDMIYEPLGLTQTFHSDSLQSGPASGAASLWYKDQALEIPKALASFGDINSTVVDLMVFMRALISGRIFDDPATFNTMCDEWNQFGFSLSPIGPGWPIEYGLGIMRFRYPRFMAPLDPIPEVIGHTGVSGSWLFYCPSMQLILAGNVSQVTAGAVPFQTVPKMLKSLQPYFRETKV